MSRGALTKCPVWRISQHCAARTYKMSQIRSGIEYLIPSDNTVAVTDALICRKNLTPMVGFNTDYPVVVYFMDHPVTRVRSLDRWRVRKTKAADEDNNRNKGLRDNLQSMRCPVEYLQSVCFQCRYITVRTTKWNWNKRICFKTVLKLFRFTFISLCGQFHAELCFSVRFYRFAVYTVWSRKYILRFFAKCNCTLLDKSLFKNRTFSFNDV